MNYRTYISTHETLWKTDSLTIEVWYKFALSSVWFGLSLVCFGSILVRVRLDFGSSSVWVQFKFGSSLVRVRFKFGLSSMIKV